MLMPRLLMLASMCSLVTSYCPLSLLTSPARRRVTAHRCTTPRVRPTTITTRPHTHTHTHIHTRPARPPRRGAPSVALRSVVGDVISSAHRPRADVIVTCQRPDAAAPPHPNNLPNIQSASPAVAMGAAAD